MILPAYYNEHDPKAAAWLRELIRRGLLPAGEVDERSIEDVVPADLARFGQCHFFAGIGVWPYALRLCGVPDDAPIWTGSCPCQPFSAAGKGQGFADERHLWPAWFHLIEQCGPAIVLGEQVSRRDGLAWFDLVSADLEGLGYACGTAPAPAAGFGAPHERERLYWLAHADDAGSQGRRIGGHGAGQRAAGPAGLAGGLADATGQRRDRLDPLLRAETAGRDAADLLEAAGGRPTDGFWRDADWLWCRDARWRPVEPGTFPLVDGAPARVVRLRGYGNGLVAPQAAAFVEAAMDVIREGAA